MLLSYQLYGSSEVNSVAAEPSHLFSKHLLMFIIEITNLISVKSLQKFATSHKILAAKCLYQAHDNSLMIELFLLI